MHHPCFDRGLIYKKSSDLFCFILYYFIGKNKRAELDFLSSEVQQVGPDRWPHIASDFKKSCSGWASTLRKKKTHKKRTSKEKRKKEMVIFHTLCYMTVCRSSRFAEACSPHARYFTLLEEKVRF